MRLDSSMFSSTPLLDAEERRGTTDSFDIASYEDPAIAPFLDLLAKDIERPERLRIIDNALISRIDALVGHVEVDLHEALDQQND